MTSMLKHLGIELTEAATYFEVLKKLRWTDGWILNIWSWVKENVKVNRNIKHDIIYVN